MRSRHLAPGLLFCALALFSGGPSPDVADAQATPLTVHYRLVSSTNAGTTVIQTVEFKVTAGESVANVTAAVLLAGSGTQRVDTVGLGNILAGQTLLSSHDFSGPADFITQAFSAGSLTLALEYDDAGGARHKIVVTAVPAA